METNTEYEGNQWLEQDLGVHAGQGGQKREDHSRAGVCEERDRVGRGRAARGT